MYAGYRCLATRTRLVTLHARLPVDPEAARASAPIATASPQTSAVRRIAELYATPRETVTAPLQQRVARTDRARTDGGARAVSDPALAPGLTSVWHCYVAVPGKCQALESPLTNGHGRL